MYGWEHSFTITMAAIRKKELSKLKTMAYVQASTLLSSGTRSEA